MMAQPATTPDGYCGCNCGAKTNIARSTDPRAGTVKGRPYRFLRGHSSRGQVLSPAHVAAIVAANSGERGCSWKGDAILYSAAHHRAQKAVAGQPCAFADATCKGKLQGAFNHDTSAEYIKVDPTTGCRFSSRIEDYLPLCASHHRRYDIAQKVAA